MKNIGNFNINSDATFPVWLREVSVETRTHRDSNPRRRFESQLQLPVAKGRCYRAISCATLNL